jgi:hypothetical protein
MNIQEHMTVIPLVKNNLSLNHLAESQEVKAPFDPEKQRIYLSDDIPDPEPIYTVHGVTVCSYGNLIVIKAKQKSGKTFLVSVLIAAQFLGKHLEFSAINRNKLIAWIDTEQSKNQLHKIYRRTHLMAGFKPSQDNPGLRVYYAAELDVNQRIELFESLAKDPEIGIIVLDVSTDLINDINDPVETKKSADYLQRVSKENNILIIATIHENKKDSNATGHFGGSLQKKAECVISLEKSDGIFTVIATDTRHGDWPDFCFKIDDDGFPVPMDAPAKLTRTEIKENSIHGVLNKVLAGQRLSYTELAEKYSMHDVCSIPTAKRHIKTALLREWIKVQSDNRYILSKNDSNECF